MLAWRATLPVGILAAIAANLSTSVADGDFRFFDYFGYFTNQTNLIAAGVLLITLPFTGRERPAWIDWARACVATYLVIVTSVYWTMLSHDNISHVWANAILHGASAVVLVVDWLVEGPRRPLPLRKAGVAMIYPAVWIAVVLIRGATDGWVPYPFMDPGNGYASIAVVVGGMVIAGVVLTGTLMRLSRWRVVTPGVERARLEALSRS